MTTKAAEQQYLAEHLMRVGNRPVHIFNPNNMPLDELPVIYGFNNGGSQGWYVAVLLAEDGTYLGGHVCSDEGYMPHDLGILEGTRPNRHEEFMKHYTNGYRMEFVGRDKIKGHDGLQLAIKRNQEVQDKVETNETI